MSFAWLAKLRAAPAAWLAGLFLVKVCLQVDLYRRGFISVSADEFSRGLRAAHWALQPRFDLAADLADVWLPAEKYLNGVALWLWPSPLIVPRLTALLASAVLLIAYFHLVRRLFGGLAVAALAAVFALFQPWQAWLGGTPMLDTYGLAGFFVGLAGLVEWLKAGRPQAWRWAAFGWLWATSFHQQFWVLVNVANVLTAPLLIHSLRQRDYGQARRLACLYVVDNAFVAAYLAAELALTGQVLAAVGRHTAYSAAFHAGEAVSLLERALYYPRLGLTNLNPATGLLALAALPGLWRRPGRRWAFALLGLGAAALAAVSAFNLVSAPATAAPGRYSLVFTLLLAPYAAWAVLQFYQWSRSAATPNRRRLALAATIAVALLILVTDYRRLIDYPRGMPQEALAAGQFLKTRWDQADAAAGATAMVELRYWDFLGVQLAAGHYGAILYDRGLDMTHRAAPSLFERPAREIRTVLAAHDVRYVLLYDDALTRRALAVPCLAPIALLPGWTLLQASHC